MRYTVSTKLRISALKRIRFAPVALVAGIFAAVLLSLSLTGTLSGFAASITNSSNTAGSGTLIMQEQNAGASVTCLSTDGGSVSTNSATCSTINKFGGSTSMVPGQTVTTTVVLKNTGTVRASAFSLTPGTTCTQTGSVSGSASDLCSKLNLTITQNGATSPALFTGTLASFAASTAPLALTPLASGASSTYVFAVTLDSSATTAYQGLTAAMPMTWTFTS